MEEEEPQDEATQHREAWLVEQAERGRARQRALMNRMETGDTGERRNTGGRLSREDPGPRVLPMPVIRYNVFFEIFTQTFMKEKESSRDSAYGYSADSRIPTREPTPDYRMMASNNRRILVNLKSKRDSKLQKSKSDEDMKKQNAEYNKKKSHLKFLTDVTSDIITRGIYSERGLRSAINSQVANHWIATVS